jgi:hypothetical protein
MLNQKRSIFRKESLERLSSPERLEQEKRLPLCGKVTPRYRICISFLWGDRYFPSS